jgi:hypothetical protein
MLLRAAHRECRRRGPRLRITGPELDDLAYQAAADAVMAITRKLGQFRGESRFTTWSVQVRHLGGVGQDRAALLAEPARPPHVIHRPHRGTTVTPARSPDADT